MAPLGSTSVLGKDLKGRVAGQEDTVFTNSQLDLATISCFGFDMDYTLCEYISPEFDALACGLAAEWLVAERGYSTAILALRYDPAFPVRGLWYDRLLGNLLKTDQGGRVLAGSHGRRPLARGQLAAQYPAGIQRRDEARVFVMNTRFNLAETFLIAALTDFFDEQVQP
jgi:5'-nucleotidase